MYNNNKTVLIKRLSNYTKHLRKTQDLKVTKYKQTHGKMPWSSDGYII